MQDFRNELANLLLDVLRRNEYNNLNYGDEKTPGFRRWEEEKMAVKYIFVTGGVVSGLGKGITAASLGRLLKQRGLKVALQKFDPYLRSAAPSAL